MPLDKQRKLQKTDLRSAGGTRLTLPETPEDVLNALKNVATYPHHCAEPLGHFETHISHVFLTGDYAYKLKKPLALGFLDYSSLELRRRSCERELELNRRFAPQLYLGLATIVRTAAGIELRWVSPGDSGESGWGDVGAEVSEAVVLDYAVCMRQFDNRFLLSTLAEAGALTVPMLDGLVTQIVRFHRQAESRPAAFTSAHLRQVMLENLEVIVATARDPELIRRIEQLKTVSLEVISKQASLLDKARRSFVRLLHGDLHLGNVCLFEGQVTLFDCIEFNDSYASCDTWADVGFLIMDLFYRGFDRLAWQVINRYAEASGDYEGLKLLPLYLSYRAGVRAKVRALRLGDGAALEDREFSNYLVLAERTIKTPGLQRSVSPRLWAVGGLSGSGKSTVAHELSLQLGAIQLRSDAIRKQKGDRPLYSEAATRGVYSRLVDLARELGEAGFTVVCDATYLSAEEREQVQTVWDDPQDFRGIWCECAPQIAEQRIVSRQHALPRDPSDADVEVFRQQQLRTVGTIGWDKLNTDFSLDDLTTVVEKLVCRFRR